MRPIAGLARAAIALAIVTAPGCLLDWDQFASAPRGQFVRIEAGARHACGIRDTGELVCWGANTQGQLGVGSRLVTAVPAPVRLGDRVRDVALGLEHTCAVTESGALFCWGAGHSGMLGDGDTGIREMPGAMLVDGIVDVESGFGHSCAIRDDGRVLCWGSSATGALGTDRTSLPTPAEVAIPGNPVVAQLALGDRHSCARTDAGDVYCWGAGTQVGTGLTEPTPVPARVEGLGRVIDLDAGVGHTCAVLDDGGIRCWGDGANGQLGNGAQSDSSTPVIVATPFRAIDVAAGAFHSCARTADRKVLCWGSGEFHQLGRATTTPADAPEEVAAIQGARAITLGGSWDSAFTCAIRGDGEAVCFGHRAYGELGDDYTLVHTTPTRVVFAGEAIAMSMGDTHGCLLDRSNALHCWGSGTYARLGTRSDVPRSTPTAIPLIGPATFVSAGDLHTCVNAGTDLYCWGAGFRGQLGNGTTDTEVLPTLVPPPSWLGTGWGSVSAGHRHTCAQRDGFAMCWGDNTNGSVGTGSVAEYVAMPADVALPTTMAVRAVTAGEYSTCAIGDDTNVYCWGRNTSGQIGMDPTVQYVASPTLISGVAGATAIDIGRTHVCAIVGGMAYCWGSGSNRQLGNAAGSWSPTPVGPTGNGTFASLALGDDHSCALDTAGDVYCWGANRLGQLGRGGMPSIEDSADPMRVAIDGTVTAISSFDDTTCALTDAGAIYCWGLATVGCTGDGQAVTSWEPVEVRY